MKENSIMPTNIAVEHSLKIPIGVFSTNAYLSKPHHHIEYELFYLDKGTANFHIEDNCHAIHAGDVIFLQPEIEHYVEKPAEGSGFHYCALVFDSSIFGNSGDQCRSVFDVIRIRRFLTLPDEMLEKMQEYIILKHEEGFGCNFLLKSFLFELVAYILQTKQYELVSPLMFAQKHTVSAIDNAILYIREHFKENISFEDIQKTTDYSKSHFARLFKETLGMNVTEYLNKFRIEKSCLDLIYTDKNITEIAMENGFNNIQYFSRVFKQFMDCTPKQYQRKAKDVIVPSAIPGSIQI